LCALAGRAGHEIIGVFTERASGARNDRIERRKVLALIDAVLVSELSRWGRSTKDLIETLDGLHDRGVSVIPLNGQSFDLSSANGKLMRTLIARRAHGANPGSCLLAERQAAGPSTKSMISPVLRPAFSAGEPDATTPNLAPCGASQPSFSASAFVEGENLLAGRHVPHMDIVSGPIAAGSGQPGVCRPH
jgi:hypothetical protein